MSARPGMTALVSQVRELTGAGTADFTDDAVQRYLDEGRTDLRRERVLGIERQLPGSVIWPHFHLGAPVESGTAFVVTDSLGGTVGTALYSLDAVTGIVEFPAGAVTADGNAASEIYVDARLFDPYGSSANLIDAWAASLSISGWGITQDGQTLARDQRIKSMNLASRQLRSRARTRRALLRRQDG